tara:strand:+ start:679 stop:1032 length:354 start_codon:yes stop_codon:yes gene_type:complete
MMKITIGKRKALLEQATPKKPHIYEIVCEIKLRKDADREALKTDIRALPGVTIVNAVPGSETSTESFIFQRLKIKFQPYGKPVPSFMKSISDSLRKLSKRGLASFRFKPETLSKVKI